MSKMSNKTFATAILFFAATANAAELPQSDGAMHTGVATCAASQCHGSAIPRDATGILQNEYVTWTQADPHAAAFDTLNSEQSRLIAARLGISKAHEAKECLDCHADNVSSQHRGEKFQISDGVGCEACHGGAENWLSSHYNAATQSHASNISAGMYPTNDAAARADLCLSCHLGTEFKFASHRMMAAGHPRLSFELDTFTELWRTLGRQPHFRNDAEYRTRKPVPSHSYTWAVGLIKEARLRLELIASSHFDGIGMFPELGFYDCHACHRSMQNVQWRRLSRHGTAAPGMPFINDGTFVMSFVLASAVQTESADEIEAALRRLHAAGTESVDSIRTAAAALDDLLAGLDKAVTPARIGKLESKILEAVLEAGAAGNYLDYASAEQAFMAVQMLVIELNDPELEASLDELAESLSNDERYRPAQFATLLDDLRTK